MNKYISTAITGVGFDQNNANFLQTPSMLTDLQGGLTTHLKRVREYLVTNAEEAIKMGASEDSMFYVIVSILYINTGKTTFFRINRSAKDIIGKMSK